MHNYKKEVKIATQISGVSAFLLFLSILTLTAIIYYASLSYDFLFDDYPNIVKLYTIRHKSLPHLFFANSRWITFWLNSFYYSMARFDPFIYRVGNLLIHLINGTLLWVCLMILLRNLQHKPFIKTYAHHLACITAGLFLLHPVQTQAICYVIQGQLEGCAALAILLMLFVFIVLTRLYSFYARFFASIVLCLLAILSSGTKEIAIIAPALLMLIDWFFIAEGRWSLFKRRLWLHTVLSLLVASSFCFVLKPSFFFNLLQLNVSRVSTTGNVLTTDHDVLIGPYHFFISQFKVLLHYLWIFIWPHPLSADYNWKLSEGFLTHDSFFPFLMLCILILWLGARLKKSPTDPFVFGFLWFFVSMLPRASLIPSGELIADYKTYIPSIGLLFVMALAVLMLAFKTMRIVHVYVSHRATSVAFWCMTALVLISKGYLAAQRTKVWRSAEDFWLDIITHSPKARSYNNYAFALIEKQRLHEAIPYLEKAIQLDRHYPDPWNNLAAVYGKLNNIDKGMLALQEALRINPYHAEGYLNLAAFLIAKKDYSTAENALRHALMIRPHYGKALFKLGQIYYQQGNVEKAASYFKKCCTEADFDNASEGFEAWGMASVSLKRYDEAQEAYAQAVKHNPRDNRLKMHLAYAYLFNKHYTQAEKSFKELIAQSPHDLKLKLGLAEVFVATKRHLAALTLYKKVPLELCQDPRIFLRMAHCSYKLKLFDHVEHYLTLFLHANPPQNYVKPVERILHKLAKRDFSAQEWSWLDVQ